MSRHRYVPGILFLAAVAGGWLVLRNALSVEEIAARERVLRDSIDRSPWLSFAVGFVIYTVVSLFPGTSGKSILCGWLFGFWKALVMVTVSLTVAGFLGFLVARFALARAVRERFEPFARRFERRLERDGVFYLLTVRMLHVPYTLVNYMSGALGVPPGAFVWTTLLGLLPSTAIFVWAGAGLPTVEELSHRGATELLQPPLLAALVLMGAFPWACRWAYAKVGSRRRRVAEDQ